MKKIIRTVRFISLLITSGFLASVHAATTDTQLWTSFAASGPMSDSRLLFWFDGHARFGDDVSELNTSIIRPALGWQAMLNTSWWLGYARVTGHAADPNIEEDRVWQQALYRVGELAGGQLSARTRLEQRFRDEDNDVGVRLRQFFRWSKPYSESSLSTVIANELFINLNDADWGQSDGYNQNRLFLGVNVEISQNYRFEFGYVNNHINRKGGENHLNHVLSGSVVMSW